MSEPLEVRRQGQAAQRRGQGFPVGDWADQAGQTRAASRLGELAMYLAVAGGGAAFGAILGAMGRAMWSEANPAIVQGGAIVVGTALGGWWCLTAGRRWASHPWDDAPESARHRNGSHEDQA